MPPRTEALPLGLPTHQAGADRARGLQPVHRVGGLQHPQHLDLAIDALHGRGTEGFDLEVPPHDLVGVVADDQSTGRRQRLEARGLVRCGADHRVVRGRVGHAHLGDEDDTGVDPHPGGELDPALAPHVGRGGGDTLEELEAREHRVAGVVLARLGEPEVHHDAVALVPRDVPVVGGGRGAAELVVLAEHVAHHLGLVVLGHLGRSHEVDEHHRELAPLVVDVVGRERRGSFRCRGRAVGDGTTALDGSRSPVSSGRASRRGSAPRRRPPSSRRRPFPRR